MNVNSPNARVRKLAKLTRTLGENVPVELVFPSTAPYLLTSPTSPVRFAPSPAQDYEPPTPTPVRQSPGTTAVGLHYALGMHTAKRAAAFRQPVPTPAAATSPPLFTHAFTMDAQSWDRAREAALAPPAPKTPAKKSRMRGILPKLDTGRGTWRKKENTWSGEWNIEDMHELQHRLQLTSLLLLADFSHPLQRWCKFNAWILFRTCENYNFSYCPSFLAVLLVGGRSKWAKAPMGQVRLDQSRTDSSTSITMNKPSNQQLLNMLTSIQTDLAAHRSDIRALVVAVAEDIGALAEDVELNFNKSASDFESGAHSLVNLIHSTRCRCHTNVGVLATGDAPAIGGSHDDPDGLKELEKLFASLHTRRSTKWRSRSYKRRALVAAVVGDPNVCEGMVDKGKINEHDDQDVEDCCEDGKVHEGRKM
uniref:Uncharacterized protein n=1 Tax=Mycena chlorophos TaxID=658473 RepID=A0ABQ0LQL1_MYCCL|nr:predicted protein [Mycena chlorophos]